MNMKYFKIKHIALLLAVTSAPLYTACLLYTSDAADE